MGESVLLSIIDAKIAGSCTFQVTPDNKKYVSNKTECLAALSQLEDVAIEGSESKLASRVRSEVIEFKARHDLSAY